MEFRILGPLEVYSRDGRLALGGPKRRGLLALLLVRRGHVLAADRIAGELGSDGAGGVATVQTYVSQLRRLLSGAEGVELVTRPTGYALQVPADALDAARFEAVTQEAADATDPSRRVELCDSALGLWRSAPLEEFSWPWATTERARLEQLRLETLGRRIDARLERGEHYELLGELEQLTVEYPFDERLWCQRMLACYRSGRQAEALRAYQQVRRQLGEQLGIEPSPDLAALEQRILDHDPTLSRAYGPVSEARTQLPSNGSLDCDSSIDRSGIAASGAGLSEGLLASQRGQLPTGVLTFLMTDVEGSTALWEGDRSAMSRALEHHDAVIAALVAECHGRLMKQQGEGDSTLSVFSNASDALAAAVDIQRALQSDSWPSGLALSVRIAIYTGEAELRDGDYFGPTLNRAARLRSLGAGGHILVSGSAAEVLALQLPDDVTLVDRGKHMLRGSGRSEHVHQVEAPGLATTLVPLATRRSAQQNLPEELSTFVGRRRELDELRKVMKNTRLVTLVGAGGCGKSRLARRLGSELVGTRNEGVWLVELAPVSDPSLVVSTVNATLGVADQEGRPIETLIDALTNRAMVLILDNCEHLLDAAAQLAYAVLSYCPRLTVLATSREPLSLPGEFLYRVPSLTLPPSELTSPRELMRFESVQLFVDRGAQHHASFGVTADNADAVGSICRRLDGIPLALELAAGRLRSLSVADIDRRLDQRFQLLTGSSSVLLPRQQTLRATVEWSYDLLKDREQLVFARLSTFAGGWTVDAAEAVAADATVVQGEDVLDIVGALADKNLIETEATESGTRYRFLETIRAYACDRLAALGEYESDETRRRHRDYFVDVVETAAPHLIGRGQAWWLQALEIEHDNIRRAFATIASDSSDEATDAGLRLASAMYWLWGIRPHTREGTKLANEVLERSDARPPALLRSRALIAVGWLAPDDGEYEMARERLDEAIDIARQHNDDQLLSDALESRGWLSLQLDEPVAAKLLAEEAVANARCADDSPRIARALIMAGTADHAMANLELAELALDEAIARTEELDDAWELGRALNQRALLMVEAGELVEARKLVERSRALHASLGTSVCVADSNLALVAILSGDVDTAAQLWTEALRLALHRSSPRYEIVDALAGQALVASARGDLDRAAMLHGAADGLDERPGVLRARLAFKQLSVQLRASDRARLRTELGTALFEQLHSKGRHLSHTDAMTIALQ